MVQHLICIQTVLSPHTVQKLHLKRAGIRSPGPVLSEIGPAQGKNGKEGETSWLCQGRDSAGTACHPELCPGLLLHTQQGSDPHPAAARGAEGAAFGLKTVAEGFSDPEHWLCLLGSSLAPKVAKALTDMFPSSAVGPLLPPTPPRAYLPSPEWPSSPHPLPETHVSWIINK